MGDGSVIALKTLKIVLPSLRLMVMIRPRPSRRSCVSPTKTSLHFFAIMPCMWYIVFALHVCASMPCMRWCTQFLLVYAHVNTIWLVYAWTYRMFTCSHRRSPLTCSFGNVPKSRCQSHTYYLTCTLSMSLSLSIYVHVLSI